MDAFLERSGSRFRAHVMPVAVGIYLPLALMVPIFLGGIVSVLLKRTSEAAVHNGVLISSGLIAGEAIAGILIAIPKTLPQFAGVQIPIPVVDSLGISNAGDFCGDVGYLSRFDLGKRDLFKVMQPVHRYSATIGACEMRLFSQWVFS